MDELCSERKLKQSSGLICTKAHENLSPKKIAKVGYVNREQTTPFVLSDVCICKVYFKWQSKDRLVRVGRFNILQCKSVILYVKSGGKKSFEIFINSETVE